MKKLLLFFVACFFMTAASFAQTTYYSQNFNDGLPMGWTTEGVENGWVIGSPADVSSAYFGVPETADGLVACFNDDGLGQDAVGGGSLISEAIDLSDVTGDMYLEFGSFFPNLDYQGNDETAKVSISTDEGATWTEIMDLTGAAAFQPEFLNISDYAGQMVWLRFTYEDGGVWNYGWAFDDVSISDQITSLPARSFGVHAGGAIMLDDAVEGTEYHVDGLLYNQGSETITSYDLTLSDGTSTYTESFTDVEIPYNTTVRFSMEQGLMVEGNKTWTLTLENVNGADEDEDESNNSMDFSLNAINDLDPNKAVTIEEATGTWCTWCPRGAVFLDEMSKRFGEHFVGIAVHNGQNDPMVLGEYDNAITSFPNFEGFPSVIYQRTEILDPGEIVAPSLADMRQAPPAGITVGATYDEATRELVTSVDVSFLQDVAADHNVAIVLTEDGLTGTGEGWTQINAYAGGAQGAMGGFEILPSAVPGELMVYNHVGRALIGGFEGAADAIVGDYVAGQSQGYIFDGYTIPADFVTENMHIVGLLLDNSGKVVNAQAVSIDEAVANGLVNTKSVFRSDLAEVFPNPAQNQFNVQLSLETSSDVLVEVYNAVGQRVFAENRGTLSGENIFSVATTNFANGVYTLHIQLDNGTSIVKKVSVQK